MNSKILIVFFGAVVWLSSCSPKLVLDGKTTYDLKQYNVAPELLEKDFSTATDEIAKREIAFKIADSYRRNNQYAQAEKWYQKLADLGQYSALLQQAKMQQSQEKYDEAIATLTKFGKVDALSKNLSLKEIKDCEDAKEWKANQGKFVVENITKLNSPQNDFAPSLQNGKLIFSSSRKEATGKIENVWTGEPNADIFVSKKVNNEWITPASLDSLINTVDFEGTTAITPEGNQLFFTRCGTVDLSSKQAIREAKNQYCHVFFTKKIAGNWSEPEQLNLFPDTINVGQPAISSDGKTLIVSSDAPFGFGGKDLYLFTKTDTGWGEMTNLGLVINTKGDEMFPWLDEKGYLYYSSNGLPGMGGLDIFKATKTKKLWKDPQNLRSPINSGADDFGYVIEKYKPTSVNDEILKSGYFSSNRIGGKGGDDIYSFAEKWVNYFVLEGLVNTKKFKDPENPDSEFLGMTGVDKVMVILQSTSDSITLLSNPAGRFTSPLKAETDYKITVYKPGYFAANTNITTKGKRNQDSTYLYVFSTVTLDKIFPQKEIVIPNIYYDYNKATLRSESMAVLDSILIFFNDNKDLSIEIGSHTDSRGSDAYNEKLSQARAQSVVDYLILKGVEKSRLTAKGYGETKPTNRCVNGVECSEEEHQQNRRTTFRIVGSSGVIESTIPEEIKTVPKE